MPVCPCACVPQDSCYSFRCMIDDFLLLGRMFDNGKTIENLSLLSLHHWGENPDGIWSLDVRNTKPDASQKGIFPNHPSESLCHLCSH